MNGQNPWPLSRAAQVARLVELGAIRREEAPEMLRDENEGLRALEGLWFAILGGLTVYLVGDFVLHGPVAAMLNLARLRG